LVRHRLLYPLWQDTKVLTEQSVPEASDGCLDPRIPAGLDCQVTLGIEAEGPVGQVGGANTGKRIVDNTDFRVDEDRAGRHAVEYWVDEAETAELVMLLQAPYKPVA